MLFIVTVPSPCRCSDGAIRVFTASEDRAASNEEITEFEAQVSSSQIPTQVGDIDSEKLSGPEALLTPGRVCVVHLLDLGHSQIVACG